MGLLPIPAPVDKKVRVSSNDKVSSFLNGKLVAGAGITFTENNNGANETLTIASTGASYTDEQAQDAIGAMIDGSLVYVDATPLLTRAALTGDVTASQGSNALTIANDAVTFAKMQDVATGTLLGRTTAGTGDIESLTNIPTVTMSGNVVYMVSGPDVAVTDGGTGLSTLTTAYGLLAAGTTATGNVQTLSAGLTTQILVGGGIAALPAWGTDLPTAISIGGSYIYRDSGSDVALTDGGTGSSLVASAGGIFYSTVAQGAILAGTATANQVLLSGASVAPVWSTATYPATTVVNQILYSSATNVIGGITTGNSGLLITSAGGIPSIGTDIPTAVTIGSAYITRVGGTDVTVADGGTNSSAALTNQKVMTSVGGAIVESGAITDGESIQRNNTTFISAPLPLGTCEGRLTLTSGTAVTTADVTAAGTIYFALYKGDRIYLYDGTRWKLYSFTERSLALTVTSGNNYDVFIYDNAGTITLELSAAWTTDNTRADALTTQNGIYVKSGATTRRWLGTSRASGANTVEDSASKRYVWNYYNRVIKHLYKTEATVSWTYQSTTVRAANNSTANRVEVVVGILEDSITVSTYLYGFLYATAGNSIQTGIGEDSTTARVSEAIGGTLLNGGNWYQGIFSTLNKNISSVGYHYYQWVEAGNTDAVTTFYGNSTSGISGFFKT